MFKRILEEKEKGISHLFWFLWSRILFHTGLCKIVKYQVNTGKFNYKLHFSKNATAMTTFLSGDIEKETTDFLIKNIKNDDICIDIGANIGTVTIPMSILAKDGKILSFEANPNTFKSLTENINLNNLENISAHNFALGDKESQIYFSNLKNDDMNHILSENSPNAISVEMKKLDTFTKDILKISLIKIDVEGFEKYVLMGGMETLKKTEKIIFEVNNANLENYDYDPIQVFQYLEESGFSIFNFNLEKFDFRKDTKYNGNYLAIKA